MKRIALFFLLCIVAAAAAIGVETWQWRDRKRKDDARAREQSAAENAASGRLGLKTLPLPPHPLDRRAALDDALRLEPDRRFLLAARELSGSEIGLRFSDGKWILAAGQREIGRLAELPTFDELMKAIAPLAREWAAAARLTGKAPRTRALRGHKEAFTAVREAQTRWSRGDRGSAVLHEAASAAAALLLQLPRAFDADDRLDAHAIALCAADEAAGADVRGEQAMLALALGYAGAARTLAPEDEPALHAYATLDRRKLAEAARRRDANAGDRHLLLRWLMQDADGQGLRKLIGAARNEEHISVSFVGQLLLDPDLQTVAAASEALESLVLAELEGVHASAPNDVDLPRILRAAENSALQDMAGNEDFRARLAADLRQADTAYEGPLWRAADTSAWYAAAATAALWGTARSGLVLRPDASGLADELGTWPVPAAVPLNRWLKARVAVDRGALDEAYDALAGAKLPGPRAVADLLGAVAKLSEPPDPRMIEAVRMARRHFDSRPSGRLIWAEVLRAQDRELDRSARLVASLTDGAPGSYPAEEVALADQRGRIDRLEQMALDDRLPYSARLAAASALADRGGKARAENALRRLGRERPADMETQERLIRFLRESGRPADALATAMELVRISGDDDSVYVARARCAAARQLDSMGRHQEALTLVERALPTEAPCAYRIATVQLAHLNRKQDAENLLLAYLARHPTAATAGAVAEVRWRSRDDAGAADILAHPPVGLARRDFREIGERFADVFRDRPAADVKRAAEALLQAGIQAQFLLELAPPLAKAGAAAQAFELYALLDQKMPEKSMGLVFKAWTALRAAKGAKAAESWLRKQVGPRHPAVVDEELASSAYGEGFDDALWELLPARPPDPAFADRLLLLRAASLARRGERGARRDAVLAQVADPLAKWKALLARYLRLPGAYASWEVRAARYLLAQTAEEDLADEATEGSRPCEAPYWFGVRAAAESRAPDAAAWYRVALECRNPEQPELAWAWQSSTRPAAVPPPSAKPMQASR